jgi:hypothetical protein
VEQARRWRLKAEEYRTVADQMKGPMARASMRQLAQTYDRLANGLEERALGLFSKKPEAG